MKAGITILPEYRWAEAKPRWQAAERYGFDHVWTWDHVGGTDFVDGPWFGAVPTLALAAEVTSRVELGLLVASPNFRHPVPFAREVTALDDASGGRFTLGIGSGGAGGYDTKVFGGTNRVTSPFGRYTEFVELLDELLRHDDVTWSGEHYRAEGARNLPGCVQRPRVPFVLAANGPKGLRLAARRGEGWVTTGLHREGLADWWSTVAELSARMDEVLAETPVTGFRRFLQTDGAPVYSLSSTECYRDFLGRAAELGFTDVAAPWPREAGPYAGDEGILETVAAEVLPALP
ncbi:LLM class flavin-dependent oxidoreductase [Saccharothrix obliqua]|uniref:LLM class flavin-dependent oxidoreductase n=1 Tax=Saccharothrix obliqua TaxID=2861747 RepID=UPI001C60386F|nr:LLM class flavin-dependent oxidoreductase [Saccharothrix obliqua]MBW4718459.1 LLM class flavin-dependent oxidoreductase [Saccharothrix obliqua]